MHQIYNNIGDNMSNTTIQLIRGDYKAFNLTFTQNGVPLDLTDYVLMFTAKESTADDDDEAVILKDVEVTTNPELGIVLLELEAEDTDIEPGTYVYDFQLVDGDGKPTTVMMGTLEIAADVTRRVIEGELS